MRWLSFLHYQIIFLDSLWTGGQVDGWANGQVDRWTGGRVDEWTGGQVDEWTGGQVDRWTGLQGRWATRQQEKIA